MATTPSDFTMESMQSASVKLAQALLGDANVGGSGNPFKSNNSDNIRTDQSKSGKVRPKVTNDLENNAASQNAWNAPSKTQSMAP